MKRSRLSAVFSTLAILLTALLMGCSKGIVREKVVMPPTDLPVAIRTVTVQPFAGSTFGASFAEHIRTQLAHEGHIKVVNAGAEAVIAGTLTISPVQVQHYQTTLPLKINNQVQVVHAIKKHVSAGATYRAERDGASLGGKSYTVKFEKEWTGSSAAEANAQALSDDEVVGAAAGQLVDNVVRGVSAHVEEWEFRLQGGGSDLIESGVDYYLKELYGQADSYWQRGLKDAHDGKAQAAAEYDLGVLRLHEGKYQEAFEFFREADKHEPRNSVYMDALAKIERYGIGQNTLRSMQRLDPNAEEADIAGPSRSYTPKRRKRH